MYAMLQTFSSVSKTGTPTEAGLCGKSLYAGTHVAKTEVSVIPYTEKRSSDLYRLVFSTKCRLV